LNGTVLNTLRLDRLGLLALGVALLWGCQVVGGWGFGESGASLPGGSEASVPHGEFEGFLEIEGGRISGTLTVTPSGGRRFEGLFKAPPDLVALGEGRIREREMRLELSYEGACPGRLTLDGRWEAATGNLSGVATASDCTGDAKGTFLFLPLRDPGGVGNWGTERDPR
jgi:hypothetical protein